MTQVIRRDQPDFNLSLDVTFPKRHFLAFGAATNIVATRRVAPGRRGTAWRSALCVVLATAAQFAPITQAPAAEARDVAVEIAFTWTSRDLSTVTTGEDSDAFAAESFLVLTPNAESGLPNLGGYCVALGTENKTSFESGESGNCVFRDIDGDALYEHYSVAAPDGDSPSRGKSIFTGGTGKFAGVSGELEVESKFYAKPMEGTYQGSGVKKGTLHMPAF